MNLLNVIIFFFSLSFQPRSLLPSLQISIIAGNIHSRSFACTVFSFVAFHFVHTSNLIWDFQVFSFLSSHPVVVQRQQPDRRLSHTVQENKKKINKKSRLEIYSACKMAMSSWLLIEEHCSVTLAIHTKTFLRNQS